MKLNKKELYAGALMLVIGVITILGSLNYDIRSLVRMGPGYYPLMLGVGLVVVALLILFSPANEPELLPITDDEHQDNEPTDIQPHYYSWTRVITGVVLFIILGKYGGLVPATFALVFVSALADRKNSITSTLALAGTVTGFAIIVFHYGLQIQFSLFTWG